MDQPLFKIIKQLTKEKHEKKRNDINSTNNTIHMYSGITSGRVLNGELLYTKILEVNLFAFAYRLFRRDFSPLTIRPVEWGEISTKQSVGKLTSRIFV